jgi:long-chain fatty acid transport protein
MKKLFLLFTVSVICLALSGIAFATNGVNLIGVGASSRAMGGAGVAAPQDSISAIFNNPAAMGSLEVADEFNFAGTLFMPTVKANVKSPAPPFGVGNWSGKSQDQPYAIPAIGIMSPIDKDMRFGIAAYGVSGLGVDYRNIDPMGISTKLSVMKFTPAVSYKAGDFSVGLGMDIDYQALDLGMGQSHNYAVGARLGVLYSMNIISVGATYVTPQSVSHKRVFDFDNNGKMDNLKLEAPQQAAIGFAVKPMPGLLAEVDVKWIDWAGAKGYKDFDWDSQWVYTLGLQYKPMPNLALRAGYNYAKNPVKEHNGFNAGGTSSIQGTNTPTFAYEYFRMIGFPAIVEQHITLGLGYDLSKKVGVSLGYKYALNKTMSEKDSSGGVTLESQLKEQALDFALLFRF